MFGYFDDYSEEPAYDPGTGIDCPVCGQQLSQPLMTISLMLSADNRSYFFRVHAACWQRLSATEQTAIESLLIDALAHSKDVN